MKIYCSTWLALLCCLPKVDAILLFDTNIYTLTAKAEALLAHKMNIFNLIESCVGVMNLKPEFTVWGRTAEDKKKKKNHKMLAFKNIWMHLERARTVSGFIQDQEKKASRVSVSLHWQGAEMSSSTGHSLPGKNSPACWLITTQQFIYNIPHWVCSGEYLLMQDSHTCPETQDCCAVQLETCLHYLVLSVMNQSGGGSSSGLQVMVRFPCFNAEMVLSFCSNTNKRTKKLWKKKKLAKLLCARRKEEVRFFKAWKLRVLEGDAEGDELGENGEKPSVFSAGPSAVGWGEAVGGWKEMREG